MAMATYKTESAVKKRSLVVDGRRTSVSIEQPFWDALMTIAKARGIATGRLVAEIETGPGSNLSSKIRLYILADRDKRIHDLMESLQTAA